MSDMGNDLIELIKTMADGKRVHSSPALLQSLQQLGLKVHEDGTEVRLAKSLELLDAESIRASLADRILPISCLEVHWSIDSTNNHLMSKTGKEGFHGSVCLAERQISGRGRRGRTWVSPFGRNIYLSIGWNVPRTSSVAGLSLVMGMQVVRSLRSSGVVDAGLKWPNDVLLGGGKLSGILIELAAPAKKKQSVVVGVGVNLQLEQDEAAAIDQPWSSASEVLDISRNELVCLLIRNLTTELARFSLTGFRPYQHLWNDFNLYLGKAVLILKGDGVVEGIDRGVDEVGNLKLETVAGIQTFNAGEVSLRIAR